jgi:hypothetical protein
VKRLVVALACAFALLAVGCGDKRQASAVHDGLPELTDVGQLRAAFDAHPGVPRLVILLSPT